jgi:hypothetical protein
MSSSSTYRAGKAPNLGSRDPIDGKLFISRLEFFFKL